MTAGSGLFANQKARAPHTVQAGPGVSGEVADLRDDIKRTMAPMAALTVEEFTNPPAASTNAIKLAIASSLSAVSYSGAALDGAVGAGVLNPPRNITVTVATGTPADAPATALITGVDVAGRTITETINVPQTATTAVGAKAFAKVTSIAMPVGQGTTTTIAFGFGALIGLSKKIMTRAGLTGANREVEAGVVVTTGTFAAASVGAPNGTYSPANAADGARDYAIYYEYDPSAA